MLFFSFFSLAINAQYISEDGEIDRETMGSDIKTFPHSSKKQNDFIKEILNELVSDLKGHPAIQESKEKRDKLTLTIMDLGSRRGDFSFLNPHHVAQKAREERRTNDTISMYVLILEERLAAMQDSIRGVYQELKDIVEDEDQTRATKKKAITLFATSNDLKDIEYIFENSSNHMFPSITSSEDIFSDKNRGTLRTGMNALYWDKIPGNGGMNKITEDHNWILFPFMVKYWGDPEWNIRVGRENLLEYVIARRMFLRDLNKPELLVEFMRANAEDPDTPIFKMLE